MAVVVKLVIAAPFPKSHVTVIIESLWALGLIVGHQQLQLDGILRASNGKVLGPKAYGSLISSVAAAEACQGWAFSIAIECTTIL